MSGNYLNLPDSALLLREAELGRHTATQIRSRFGWSISRYHRAWEKISHCLASSRLVRLNVRGLMRLRQQLLSN